MNNYKWLKIIYVTIVSELNYVWHDVVELFIL